MTNAGHSSTPRRSSSCTAMISRPSARQCTDESGRFTKTWDCAASQDVLRWRDRRVFGFCCPHLSSRDTFIYSLFISGFMMSSISTVRPALSPSFSSGDDLWQAILKHIRYTLGQSRVDLSATEILRPLSLAIRDKLIDGMLETEERYRSAG